MKDSKKYTEIVNQLLKELKPAKKTKKPEYGDPIDALLFACLSEHMSDYATKGAIKKIHEHFVDLNELRVSRAEEIIETLEIDSDTGKKISNSIDLAFNGVFNKLDVVSLEELLELGKRAAREELEKIDGMNKYAISYVMLTAFDAHAIPLTEGICEYLRKNEYVDPQADYDDINGFLERVITAANDYDFFIALKKAAESDKPVIKVKAAAKKTAKKKTTKKKS